MTTTFDVLVAMAQRLPGTVRGVATGGGYTAGPPAYTYLDDCNVLSRYENDAFNGGTLLIESGVLTGAVLVVSDSIQTTGRLALSGLLWELNTVDTPAAGDRYTLVNSAWPVGVLLATADEALRQWGQIETEVKLGTGDGETTEFDLPAGTTGDVARVYLVNEGLDIRVDAQWWEETATGVAFEDAPSDSWTVWATMVDWWTLTDTDADVTQTYGATTQPATGEGVGWDEADGWLLGQTFTPAYTMTVEQIALYMNNIGEYLDYLVVALYTTAMGAPSAEIKRATTFTEVGTLVTATLDAAVELTGGTTYAVVVYIDGSGTLGLDWYGHTESAFTGAAYKKVYGGSWAAHSTIADFGLRLVGTATRSATAVWPDVVPVEFCAWYGVYALLRGRVGIPGHDQEGMVQLMNYALERAEGERMRAGHVGARSREKLFRG